MSLVRTGKEIARHILHSLGHNRSLKHLQGDRRRNFEAIYETGVWTRGNASNPSSGEGSTVEATAVIRRELRSLVEQLGTTTFVDIGCGDFNWMQLVDLPCDYVGIDIVKSVIDRNQELYACSTRRFLLVDAVAEPIPVSGDLVCCREVLFHLSFADAKALLANALKTGCSHLLLTSDRDTHFNADIQSGDFRMLNLEKKPFGLAAPICRIDDSAVAPGRFMGLWSADAIRTSLQH